MDLILGSGLTEMLIPCLGDLTYFRMSYLTNLVQFAGRKAVVPSQLKGLKPELTGGRVPLDVDMARFAHV
jgi:hypothetical protein